MTSGKDITIPGDWVGTAPEYYVYWALTKLKVNFEYQSDVIGGRAERGGAVLDFYLPDYSLGINVQSVYWHYARPNQRINDAINRLQVEGTGIILIYIDEENAESNPIYYVQEAIKGIDHSRMT